jgi:hypothetical protein
MDLIWKQQIRDMDNEDRHHEFAQRNTIYPNELFNLISNPIFYLNPYKRRMAAVRDILLTTGSIKKGTIFYDHHNDVVYFESVKNIQHRCDILNRHTRVISKLA